MSDAFHSTRWSLLERACDSQVSDPAAPSQERALNELCDIYWKPLYWFVRRAGHDAHDAADLVQGFFQVVLERGDLAKADRRKGRMRSFLLALLKGYLSDRRKYNNALKRGGGVPPVSIDATAGEEWMAEAGRDAGELPELGFDRVWAELLLARCLDTLRGERAERDQAALFDALRPHLLGAADLPEGGLAALADPLGISPGSIRVALHRLRERLRELLRAEVQETLSPDESLEAELRYLASVLSAGRT